MVALQAQTSLSIERSHVEISTVQSLRVDEQRVLISHPVHIYIDPDGAEHVSRRLES